MKTAASGYFVGLMGLLLLVSRQGTSLEGVGFVLMGVGGYLIWRGCQGEEEAS